MTSNTTTILRFQRPSRGCETQVVRLSSSAFAQNYVGSGEDPSMLQKAGNKDGLRYLNTPQVSMPILSCLTAGIGLLRIRALLCILLYLPTRS